MLPLPAEGSGVVQQWFSVLLNVNLALLNLLPFPVLDGGHIFIMAIETISRRDFSTIYLHPRSDAQAKRLERGGGQP